MSLASAVATKSAPKPYVFFVLAALSILMASIDNTIVAVALPSMMDGLDTSLAWIGWTLTVYSLLQTVMMPLAGKLSERFGRNRMFLACVALFTVGSLLCGLAPNVYLLIFFRAIQGLGGGGLMPSAVGIVSAEFPRNRDRLVGLFSSIFPLGGIIGPNVGGLIIEHASWREVFLVNVPIGVVVLVLLARRLGTVEAVKHHRVDVRGAVLLAGAIASLLGAFTLLGNDVSLIRSPQFWLLLLASVVLLAGFTWHEVHTEEPVIDLQLVVRNPFLAVNAYNFIYGACVFGFFSFIPYYAVVQFGMRPAESGEILTPRSILMICMSTVASLFLIRRGYRWPMIGGMFFVVGSLFLLSRGITDLTIGSLHVNTFWLLAAEVGLAGIGMGLAAPSSNNAALDLLPGRAAVITGVRGMFRSTGGVLGIAVIVLCLEFSPDKAAGLRTIFLVLSGLLLVTLPITFAIPDTARGRHERQTAARPIAQESTASS